MGLADSKSTLEKQNKPPQKQPPSCSPARSSLTSCGNQRYGVLGSCGSRDPWKPKWFCSQKGARGASEALRLLGAAGSVAGCLLTANTTDQQNVGLKDLRLVEEAVGRVRGHQLGDNGHDDYYENWHQLKKCGIGVLERTTRTSRDKGEQEKAVGVRM